MLLYLIRHATSLSRLSYRSLAEHGTEGLLAG